LTELRKTTMNLEPVTVNATAALVRLAAKAISDKKGIDIVAYNVSGASSITDYYLVCSGLNNPHLKALANETRSILKNHGINCWRASGSQESGWMMADYIDFVIHFFKKDVRAYYRVDELWQSAPKLVLNLEPLGASTELSRSPGSGP
jgi:ribosome-associated protein